MQTHNPENERIKHRYFAYLREAKGRNAASIDPVAKALDMFECYTKFRDFKLFHPERVAAFKRHLAAQVNARTGEPLSKATMLSTLNALRQFHHWLAEQSGFRRRVTHSDAEYFSLSEKDTRIAKAHREPRVPTLDQILHVIQTMPMDTEMERRNRAVIAFTLLTGARDSAIASFKLRHIDLAEECVVQDAREVQTKFSKTFTTWFFPVGDEVKAIVVDWVRYLTTEKLWGLDDPLFPATRVTVGESRQFEAAGLDRKHWSSAAPIRKIFREAFEAAEVPYFNPHSFRNTLALMAERTGNVETFKAWSQNLGHERAMTTLTSYGRIPGPRQAQLIRASAPRGPAEDDTATLLRKALAAVEAGAGRP